jgi:hypothetical protein
VARLIRGTLASAIVAVLNSHLESEGLFGLFATPTHVWDFFRAASNPELGASSMHREIGLLQRVGFVSERVIVPLNSMSAHLLILHTYTLSVLCSPSPDSIYHGRVRSELSIGEQERKVPLLHMLGAQVGF